MRSSHNKITYFSNCKANDGIPWAVVYRNILGIVLRKIIGNMDVNQLLKAAPYFTEETIQVMIQQLKNIFFVRGSTSTHRNVGAPLVICCTQDSQAERIPIWSPVFICIFDEPMMYMKIGSIHFAILFKDKHMKQLQHQFAKMIPKIEEGLLCRSKSFHRVWYKRIIQKDGNKKYKEKLKGKKIYNMYEDYRFTHINLYQ